MRGVYPGMHLGRGCGQRESVARGVDGVCVDGGCMDRGEWTRGCMDGGIHLPPPKTATDAVGTYATRMHYCHFLG